MLFLATLFGCKSIISTYGQFAYLQAASLKVGALNLVDKVTESYKTHSKDVENIDSELMKNIEYEKHHEKNQISIEMYNIL